MLPFLKNKDKSPGVSVIYRKDTGMTEVQHDEEHAIDSCSEDLIRAINNKDIKAVSAALKAAFEILDKEPESEGQQIDEME